MNPSSLSTFNSDAGHARKRRARRFQQRVIAIMFWTIGLIVLLDVAVGLLFRLPADVQKQPSALQVYFDYGRSIEGKLRRLVGPTLAEDAPIVKAGWIEPQCDHPSSASPGKIGIDMFGMSFSVHVAQQIEQLNSNVAITNFGGPGAPASHSYTCFVHRHERHIAHMPVQVLGVLGSSLPRMKTLGGLTTSFEAPQPFTYPRYQLTPDGHLIARWASVRTQQDVHDVLASPNRWSAYLDELAAGDAFYEDVLMRSNASDHSVILRMLRRAWAQRTERNRIKALNAADGFSGAPDIPRTLTAMLLDFQRRCLAIRAKAVVILFEDRGYEGAFARVVPALKAEGVNFVLTSTIASTHDPNNFISDGHFTPAVDARIAQVVLDILGYPTQKP